MHGWGNENHTIAEPFTLPITVLLQYCKHVIAYWTAQTNAPYLESLLKLSAFFQNYITN